jgi:hypothetical protein
MSENCGCGTCTDCGGAFSAEGSAVPARFRHSEIHARMMARIGRERALDGLTTRDGADPAIALADAFSGALHVLAFNAERLAEDGSLRTASSRSSLVELARMLGYRPRPAISAEAILSFSVDDLPGSPGKAMIPPGTKVASIPGQDETPQTFETSAALDARMEWNALKPYRAQTAPALATPETTTSLLVAGVSLHAQPGDLVALVTGNGSGVAASWIGQLANVERLASENPAHTKLVFNAGFVATTTLSTNLIPGEVTANPPVTRVIVLGRRAAPFGAVAPNWGIMPTEVRERAAAQAQSTATPKPPHSAYTDWPGIVTSTNTSIDPISATGIDLDAVYREAAKSCHAYVSGGGAGVLTTITAAQNKARTDFGLSATISHLNLAGSFIGSTFTIRDTSLSLETERLALQTFPSHTPLPVTLDQLVVEGKINLLSGRLVILSGLDAATGGARREPARILRCEPDGANTRLVFTIAVSGRFNPEGLVVLANCIEATHGETPASGPELLGSSNYADLRPIFALSAQPLAHVPASNARGFRPAIEVRVEDRLFDEVERTYALPENARAYAVTTRIDGKSVIEFASRLPGGTNNVTALQRKGGGSAGMLAAEKLKMQMSPVLGIRGVTNPLPAQGASDAETPDDIRRAAPASVTTLDRVVSLSDFENFARAYRGIGKALASEIRYSGRRTVLLTLATSDFQPVLPISGIGLDLKRAIIAASPPSRVVLIEGFTPVSVVLTLALAADPALRKADIETAVRAALEHALGKSARTFGQPVSRAEILAVAQATPGVIAAHIVRFERNDLTREISGFLPAAAPHVIRNASQGETVVPAEFLTLESANLLFQEMRP